MNNRALECDSIEKVDILTAVAGKKVEYGVSYMVWGAGNLERVSLSGEIIPNNNHTCILIGPEKVLDDIIEEANNQFSLLQVEC